MSSPDCGWWVSTRSVGDRAGAYPVPDLLVDLVELVDD